MLIYVFYTLRIGKTFVYNGSREIMGYKGWKPFRANPLKLLQNIIIGVNNVFLLDGRDNLPFTVYNGEFPNAMA